VIDLVAALGVEAVAEGHVRLVLDLPAADVDQLLRDLKRINESESRITRQAGHQWVLPAWRAAVWTAASATLSTSIATHRVSHAPLEAFALGPLAHAIPTSEAAKALGVSLQEVRRICRTGKLRAQQAVGGRREWVVDAEAVDAIVAARGRPSGDAPPLAGRPAVLGG
jgi:hypothetical protein